MNFKRGIEPKDAMGIGQIAMAPVIKNLYYLDPTNMVQDKSGKLFPGKSRIFYEEAALEKIEKGNSNYNLRFVAFSTGTEIDSYGQDVIHRLTEYKGLYVKFGDRAFKIPK